MHSFIRSLVDSFLGGNPEEVNSLYKAAEQGDAKAQYNLGVMCREGRGVPQDNQQALSWYRKAAEQGHIDAQYNLGVMYEEGLGVPQDDSQSQHWYRKATEQGHAEAKDRLGLARGKVLNNKEAESLLLKALRGPRNNPS